MAVDVGQVLMLALAVPAMCLLLYVLTQVEKWLLKDDSPHLRGQTGTGAEGGEEGQLIPGPPGAVDAAAASRAAARDEDAPGTAPPGGMNEAA
ncbi:MAG TPA: hypothetical protein VF933_04285 [Streptosporangiaceae bacterium]